MTDQEIIEAGLMTEAELIADNLEVELYRTQVIQAQAEQALTDLIAEREAMLFEWHILALQCKEF